MSGLVQQALLIIGAIVFFLATLFGGPRFLSCRRLRQRRPLNQQLPLYQTQTVPPIPVGPVEARPPAYFPPQRATLPIDIPPLPHIHPQIEDPAPALQTGPAAWRESTETLVPPAFPAQTIVPVDSPAPSNTPDNDFETATEQRAVELESALPDAPNHEPEISTEDRTPEPEYAS